MKCIAFVSMVAATLAAADTPSSSSTAANPGKDRPPIGALWSSTWSASTLHPFVQSCHTQSVHRGKLHTLSRLYPELEEFAPQLKVFYNQQPYPGSWDGADPHGNERELLQMQMQHLPWKVREWIKRNATQRHYSVHDDVVFFAPGAIYPILPLWVEGEREGCEGVFDGLETYSNEPKDGSVIGKVSHTEDAEEAEFTVEALRVTLRDGAERSEL
ncbi:uncharacterized protein EKO05_0011541 [Ascochyta rabiei]|uniref:Uncharacterized protein n=1 Tax=Didymella rabiei TaxID=5454 RepID=A0A163AKG7_DIDRA|nr:uncharacterized protein EKO05_0011541 [Ascochyta rabiei]KZM21241.1 hypothetical protein ST47_g7616 [Ascochyta rabiei]UPX21355.1 hypothetical protein EKO05_0011541 [Ascochyta rabiei]